MEIDYSKIPSAHMVRGVMDYVEYGVLGSGSFLEAILTNDFRLALFKADETNRHFLGAWAEFLHWELPSHIHGDRTAVSEWKAIGGTNGAKDFEDEQKEEVQG